MLDRAVRDHLGRQLRLIYGELGDGRDNRLPAKPVQHPGERVSRPDTPAWGSAGRQADQPR